MTISKPIIHDWAPIFPIVMQMIHDCPQLPLATINCYLNGTINNRVFYSKIIFERKQPFTAGIHHSSGFPIFPPLQPNRFVFMPPRINPSDEPVEKNRYKYRRGNFHPPNGTVHRWYGLAWRPDNSGDDGTAPGPGRGWRIEEIPIREQRCICTNMPKAFPVTTVRCRGPSAIGPGARSSLKGPIPEQGWMINCWCVVKSSSFLWMSQIGVILDSLQ